MSTHPGSTGNSLGSATLHPAADAADETFLPLGIVKKMPEAAELGAKWLLAPSVLYTDHRIDSPRLLFLFIKNHGSH